MHDDFEITPVIRAYLEAFDESLRAQTDSADLRRAAALDALMASRIGRRLSRREQEVLLLRCEGLSRREIARRLGIKTRTVNHHFEHVHEKAGTSDPFRLTLWAIKRGLIDPPPDKGG